jgi:ribosomal protein S18 acetylase RimI-like enzyme
MNQPVVDIVSARSAGQVETARELFVEYSKSLGVDLEYQGFSAELAALPQPYVPPRGELLLATTSEGIAGCVALRPLTPATVEMKRLYVRPGFRGAGVGQRLVEAALRTARAAGYAELRLDTLPTMGAAQNLYRQLGFVQIEPYNDAYLPGTQFFSISLVV